MDSAYTIYIKDLCLEWAIGVYEAEQDRLQPLKIDLKITTLLGGDPKADDYSKVLCYDHLTKEIIALSKQGHIGLLERLGHEIADICLAHDEITAITVTIYKPEALKGLSINGDAQVGVEITRKKA